MTFHDNSYFLNIHPLFSKKIIITHSRSNYLNKIIIMFINLDISKIFFNDNNFCYIVHILEIMLNSSSIFLYICGQ